MSAESLVEMEDGSANESSTESVRAPRSNWPPVGTLAGLLEAEITIRRRAREKGYISRWPSLQATGVPSVKAMGCNTRILEVIAEWFCPTTQHCCTVTRFRRDMDLPADAVVMNMDAEGLKKLFSHGIRRLKTGSESRDTALDDFYNILRFYWTESVGPDTGADPPAPLAIEDIRPDDVYDAVEETDTVVSADSGWGNGMEVEETQVDGSDGLDELLAEFEPSPVDVPSSSETMGTPSAEVAKPSAGEPSMPAELPVAKVDSKSSPMELPSAKVDPKPAPVKLPGAKVDPKPAPVKLPGEMVDPIPSPAELPSAKVDPKSSPAELPSAKVDPKPSRAELPSAKVDPKPSPVEDASAKPDLAAASSSGTGGGSKPKPMPRSKIHVFSGDRVDTDPRRQQVRYQLNIRMEQVRQQLEMRKAAAKAAPVPRDLDSSSSAIKFDICLLAFRGGFVVWISKGSGLKPDEEETQAYDGEAGEAAFLAAETNGSTHDGEPPNPPTEPTKPNAPKRTPPQATPTLETYDPKAGRFFGLRPS
ncbi:HERC1 [Symbiodinium sp. CCMP2592]|nr:HERC1 [Symbiodinium sp. CCMP2592]